MSVDAKGNTTDQLAKLEVVHYMRRPGPSHFSVERLYEDVRLHSPDNIKYRVERSKHLSKGIWPRIVSILHARTVQGDVNHVTGDIHFVTYLLARQKTLLTVLDCVSLERTKGVRRWLLWLLWYWLPLKRCAAVAVISESTAEQLVRYTGCDRGIIHVIHCPLSQEFKFSPRDLNCEKPRILHVGTGQNKNLARHIEALAGINCELVIIGKLDEAQLQQLEKSGIAFENHVGLTRQALVEVYEGCDMLLFASTYEGFGLPIIEAQAVGRPVVTSNILSMPEVAGEAACLVDPFDTASIRCGVLRVIEDQDYRNALAERGRRNAERFSVDKIAADYAALYSRIHSNSLKGRH